MKNFFKIVLIIVNLLLVLDLFDLYNVISHPENYPFGENDYGLFNLNSFSYNTFGNYLITLCSGIIFEIIFLAVLIKNNFRKHNIYYVLGIVLFLLKVVL